MSVELDPAELGFKRPFNHEVSQVLRLHNPNSDPVAFKVKTTAPKQYCVRPNSGRIDSGGDVEVQVLLQAMKEDPPPDARCKDKFLVQSVAVKSDTDANVTQIWSNIEQNAKSSIQEKKIRVNFLPADSSSPSGPPAATTNGVVQDDEPPAYSSPSPSAVTPQRTSASDRDVKSDPETPAQSSSIAAGAAAVIPSQEDLKRQLEEAKATIARLQSQAQEGLRNRKPQEVVQKAADDVSQSLQQQQAPGGVPLQIVAGLCLLCFLLAYFFF